HAVVAVALLARARRDTLLAVAIAVAIVVVGAADALEAAAAGGRADGRGAVGRAALVGADDAAVASAVFAGQPRGAFVLAIAAHARVVGQTDWRGIGATGARIGRIAGAAHALYALTE